MPTEATQILHAMSNGDRSGTDRLIELVYEDFRNLAGKYMGRDTPGNTLQPTAVVHEAFIKLVGHEEVDWRGRSHFFAVGAVTMRRILVDHARKRSAKKRGGDRQRIRLTDELTISKNNDEDVLAIDEALTRLAEIDQRRSQIVELIFFGGLTHEEVAEVLGVTTRTVERQWASSRAWLGRELAEDPQ